MRAIYACAYRHPGSEMGEAEHNVSRIFSAGWEYFYAERRFQNTNYLLREVRKRASPSKWSGI